MIVPLKPVSTNFTAFLPGESGYSFNKNDVNAIIRGKPVIGTKSLACTNITAVRGVGSSWNNIEFGVSVSNDFIMLFDCMSFSYNINDSSYWLVLLLRQGQSGVMEIVVLG
jgi:hypothetical protein